MIGQHSRGLRALGAIVLVSLLAQGWGSAAAQPATHRPGDPAFAPAPLGPAAPQRPNTTIIIDGVREGAWGSPAATDPLGDMTEPNYDLTGLYVTDDAANYYIGFDAPATTYGMHYGIAIDTDGIVGSGGTTNPWGRNILTVPARRPEYYLNVWHPGDGTIQNAQLIQWNGSGWNYADLVNVGGAQAYSQANAWIEYRIPKAAMNNAATLSMELFTSGGDGNHAQDTSPSDPNVAYTVPDYGPDTSILSSFVTYQGLHQSANDNNVEYAGLGHNSQDPLYRSPGGAVNPGTAIRLRFRTFHNDVTGVTARFYNTATSSETYQAMTRAASDITCYDAALGNSTCDYWETGYTPAQLTTVYYRFTVVDGSATAYYADDSFQDGGWGVPTPNLIDNSYPITVYDPNFAVIPWMRDGVVYQIFPDRFSNGNAANDPTGTEPRYSYPSNPLDQILKFAWSRLPEGYCRNYSNPAQPCTEQPRGRDYMGGDLKGIQNQLSYLQQQGVSILYLNPVFDAASNHAYDTQDYYAIDPFFGTQADWNNLQAAATARGMKIVLDGVFNHVSSDSKYFDRYGRFADVGACESTASPYRSWFNFTPQAGGPCAGPGGPGTMTYDAWFGFDSLPVLQKNVQAVRDLIYAGPNNVAQYWLNQGAAGWRLDVMSDGSFPDDYWREFRTAVKAARPDAPIVGELWKKNEMLPKIQGDQADSTMNYRFRNAILGFFGKVDNKGFVDDGQQDQPPSLFARKLLSLREDYPDAVYYTTWNIMDSHDTARILWQLTPGQDNREEKEFNAANLAIGKARLRLAALAQFTLPGAPTVYYGDEIALNGADDPDDRRTFPLPMVQQGRDLKLMVFYQKLAALRAAHPALRTGVPQFLLTDDTNRVVAYGMRDGSEVIIIAINRDQAAPHTVNVPLTGYLRNGVAFTDQHGGLGTATSAGGNLTLTLPPLAGGVWISNAGQDLTPPGAPGALSATPGNAQVQLSWAAVPGAASYNVYRSPISGGGFTYLGTTTAPTYTDSTVENGKRYYYRVTALDALGNESAPGGENSATPFIPIGFAGNLAPATLNFTISAAATQTVKAEVWVNGVTNPPGQGGGILAQFAYGPVGSDPATWTWTPMVYDGDAGNNDRYRADFVVEAVGSYDYLARFSTSGGFQWTLAYVIGTQRGQMTVTAAADLTPPAAPTGLTVLSASPTLIRVGWSPNGEPDLFRYEVWRGTTSGGPYTKIGNVPAGTTQYDDTTVNNGSTYYYVITAQDNRFNRSPNSAQVGATAAPRPVQVTFNVTLQGGIQAGDNVYVAGSFPPPYPQWTPGGIQLVRTGPTASVTLTLTEGTAIEYKYTLGTWELVEKGPACDEVGNRQLSVVYGPGGTQTVTDTVANWRNRAPCGNSAEGVPSRP